MTVNILAVLVCSMNDLGLRKTMVLLVWLYPILNLLMETLMILLRDRFLGLFLVVTLFRGLHILTDGGTLRAS